MSMVGGKQSILKGDKLSGGGGGGGGGHASPRMHIHPIANCDWIT